LDLKPQQEKRKLIHFLRGASKTPSVGGRGGREKKKKGA